jgi:hypothetical protein
VRWSLDSLWCPVDFIGEISLGRLSSLVGNETELSKRHLSHTAGASGRESALGGGAGAGAEDQRREAGPRPSCQALFPRPDFESLAAWTMDIMIVLKAIWLCLCHQATRSSFNRDPGSGISSISFRSGTTHCISLTLCRWSCDRRRA